MLISGIHSGQFLIDPGSEIIETDEQRVIVDHKRRIGLNIFADAFYSFFCEIFPGDSNDPADFRVDFSPEDDRQGRISHRQYFIIHVESFSCRTLIVRRKNSYGDMP